VVVIEQILNAFMPGENADPSMFYWTANLPQTRRAPYRKPAAF
jgi:hypothetical protein